MLGTGIYTTSEAAMLLREQSTTVRRWAFGYARNRAAGRVVHPPLIKTDLPQIEGEVALTFVELVELLYIRAFEKAGVSWPVIRTAADAASRMFNTEHPFALRQLYVDPRSVYVEVKERDGDDSLVELIGHGQHTMSALVKPYLEQLEFDVHDVASRWWPLGKFGGVVIDPRRSFGAPVVEAVGIRTSVLSAAYDAEHALHGESALERVSWTYEIASHHVQAALDFKHWLQKAA
ncbi:MAG TPA: hypothetical protein VF710_19750 [Longimicrobium sp.]|jgi:uncharacterized protein (DUF433 family)